MKTLVQFVCTVCGTVEVTPMERPSEEAITVIHPRLCLANGYDGAHRAVATAVYRGRFE